MDINVKLKPVRISKGFSQNQLARELGISASHLRHIETGQAKSIPFETLKKICNVLECKPGDILTLEE